MWQQCPTKQAGVLGPIPQQAYQMTTTPSSGYAPIDIDAAFQTLSLNPPDDN